jgi:hypothetical protein
VKAEWPAESPSVETADNQPNVGSTDFARSRSDSMMPLRGRAKWGTTVDLRRRDVAVSGIRTLDRSETGGGRRISQLEDAYSWAILAGLLVI